jgi:peptide/nickel transport system permease protein
MRAQGISRASGVVSAAAGYRNRRRTLRPSTLLASAVLAVIALASLLAPLLAPHDPQQLQPAIRLIGPDAVHFLGTDSYGRDLFSRLIYGGRVSLIIGLGTAAVSLAIGLVLGLLAGYFRAADMIVMRAMDGLMAIPNILLAVAVVSLWGANLVSLLAAIAIPEIPRVARLARSMTLSLSHEPFVEAARAIGASSWMILWRHLMPNTLGPLIVLGTYICASAIVLESILSFLGAGFDPQTPTWGNIIAEGRLYIELRPGIILWPSLLLSLTIWSVNTLGDAARNYLDPRHIARVERR